MHYHWNWHIFFESSPDGMHTYLDTLWSGMGWTLATALTAWFMALILGIAIGTMRTISHARWVWGANCYIELFRNIPLLVQMFLWYFVMPELMPARVGDWLKALPNAPFVTAVICLGFFTSSRVAVQVSAAIQALPHGQKMAATALGLTLPQTYRHILLPIAFRTVIPTLTSEFLNIIKNSAVALTIGLMELTARARSMQEFSFQVFEAFTAATIIYVMINLIIVYLMRFIEKRAAIAGLTHGMSDKGGH